MPKLSMTVEIKTQWGLNAIYPIDETAKTFAAIAGTKTLTPHAIQLIKNLGVDIKVKPRDLLGN